jgi:hypothetical protein
MKRFCYAPDPLDKIQTTGLQPLLHCVKCLIYYCMRVLLLHTDEKLVQPVVPKDRLDGWIKKKRL